MAFTARRIRVAARIVAGISLFVGLGNAFQAFGVLDSAHNPVEHYGQIGFGVLVVTAMFRLFAAVGLWAYATWGAFLLLAASLIEMLAIFLAFADLGKGPVGLGFSTLLLLAGLGLLIWRYINANHLFPNAR